MGDNFIALQRIEGWRNFYLQGSSHMRGKYFLLSTNDDGFLRVMKSGPRSLMKWLVICWEVSLSVLIRFYAIHEAVITRLENRSFALREEVSLGQVGRQTVMPDYDGTAIDSWHFVLGWQPTSQTTLDCHRNFLKKTSNLKTCSKFPQSSFSDHLHLIPFAVNCTFIVFITVMKVFLRIIKGSFCGRDSELVGNGNEITLVVRTATDANSWWRQDGQQPPPTVSTHFVLVVHHFTHIMHVGGKFKIVDARTLSVPVFSFNCRPSRFVVRSRSPDARAPKYANTQQEHAVQCSPSARELQSVQRLCRNCRWVGTLERIVRRVGFGFQRMHKSLSVCGRCNSALTDFLKENPLNCVPHA